MQTCNLQWLSAHIQTGYVGAFTRHAFGQNTATAANIEDLLTKYAVGALLDLVQAQRVDTVQGLEFTF